MSRMRPGPANRRPGFIHAVRPLRTRGPLGRRRRRTGACCDRSPGRDAWLDTLRTPGLPRRRRRPLVAVVSPLAARTHPRFALAGTEAPDCQTPVRDGPKGAVCYPCIDGPNRSPAGKAIRFEPSTGPTVPLGAGQPPVSLVPSHDGGDIRLTPRTFHRNAATHSARPRRGPLRADHPSSGARPSLSRLPLRESCGCAVREGVAAETNPCVKCEAGLIRNGERTVKIIFTSPAVDGAIQTAPSFVLRVSERATGPTY
jgi:hypothetical protein